MESFLNWSYSKKKFVENIAENIPDGIKTYVEPFVGGGDVLMWVMENMPDVKIVIADNNKNLINSYVQIRDNVNEVIMELEVMTGMFNSTMDKKMIYDYLVSEYNGGIGKMNPRNAALFIAINKTCYNGLYRLNKDGKFDVPYKNPRRIELFDRANLIAISEGLQKSTISCSSFERTKVGYKNAFYYFDPPYVKTDGDVLADKVATDFNQFDHMALRALCDDIDKHKNKFVVTNSNTADQFFQNLYSKYEVAELKIVTEDFNKGKMGTISNLLIHN